jgi:hypothetical protein
MADQANHYLTEADTKNKDSARFIMTVKITKELEIHQKIQKACEERTIQIRNPRG